VITGTVVSAAAIAAAAGHFDETRLVLTVSEQPSFTGWRTCMLAPWVMPLSTTNIQR
jgi:hypothetical protein